MANESILLKDGRGIYTIQIGSNRYNLGYLGQGNWSGVDADKFKGRWVYPESQLFDMDVNGVNGLFTLSQSTNNRFIIDRTNEPKIKSGGILVQYNSNTGQWNVDPSNKRYSTVMYGNDLSKFSTYLNDNKIRPIYKLVDNSSSKGGFKLYDSLLLMLPPALYPSLTYENGLIIGDPPEPLLHTIPHTTNPQITTTPQSLVQTQLNLNLTLNLEPTPEFNGGITVSNDQSTVNGSPSLLTTDTLETPSAEVSGVTDAVNTFNVPFGNTTFKDVGSYKITTPSFSFFGEEGNPYEAKVRLDKDGKFYFGIDKAKNWFNNIPKTDDGKLKSWLNKESTKKGLDYATAAMGAATGIISSLSGKVLNLSNLTKGLNTAYDIGMQAAGYIPVYGQAIQAGMAAGKLINTGLRSMGIGTDQLTTTDKILDSDFLALSPVSWLNKAFAKRTNSMYGGKLDLDFVTRTAGRAYTGAIHDINKDYAKSNKKVGFLSSADGINKGIVESSSDLQKISAISEENLNALAGLANPYIGLRNQMQLHGGIQGRMYAAKHGTTLYDRNTYLKVLKLKQGKKSKKTKLAKGGSINRSLDELIAYANLENPIFWQRTKMWPVSVVWSEDRDDGYTYDLSGTHEMAYGGNPDENGYVKVFPMIQDINGSLHRFLDFNEAMQSAINNNNYLLMTPLEAEIFTVANSPEEGYKSGAREFFNIPFDEGFNNFMITLPENQRYTERDKYNTYRMWELGGKPKDFQQAVDLGLYTYNENDKLYHGVSVILNPQTGNYEFLKSNTNPTLWKEEAFYNGYYPQLKLGRSAESTNIDDYDLLPLTGIEAENSKNFRNSYELVKSDPYWLYILKDGVESYRKGGAFNVIPEGALHKNRHHLEDLDEKFDEVTTKGIPVVSEENGKLILHAEVEREEIILRYEVTKKIEKLMKENTDEAAILAGELLVKEILYNTIDNTKKLL